MGEGLVGFRHLVSVLAFGHGRTFVFGSQNALTEVQGVTPNYAAIRNANPYFGRFFTAQENVDAARMVLLGQTVVRKLFGDENPVGKETAGNAL